MHSLPDVYHVSIAVVWPLEKLDESFVRHRDFLVRPSDPMMEADWRNLLRRSTMDTMEEF